MRIDEVITLKHNISLRCVKTVKTQAVGQSPGVTKFILESDPNRRCQTVPNLTDNKFQLCGALLIYLLPLFSQISQDITSCRHDLQEFFRHMHGLSLRTSSTCLTINSAMMTHIHKHPQLYDLIVRRKAFLLRNSASVFREAILYQAIVSFSAGIPHIIETRESNLW
jgi:hypothetical protein